MKNHEMSKLSKTTRQVITRAANQKHDLVDTFELSLYTLMAFGNNQNGILSPMYDIVKNCRAKSWAYLDDNHHLNDFDQLEERINTLSEIFDLFDEGKFETCLPKNYNSERPWF